MLKLNEILPKDVWHTIMLMSDDKAIYSLGSVSKTLRTFFLDNLFWRQKFRQEFFHTPLFAKVFDLLNARATTNWCWQYYQYAKICQQKETIASASKKGDVGLVKFFISICNRLDDLEQGDNALFEAAEFFQLECIELLLQKGATINESFIVYQYEDMPEKNRVNLVRFLAPGEYITGGSTLYLSPLNDTRSLWERTLSITDRDAPIRRQYVRKTKLPSAKWVEDLQNNSIDGLLAEAIRRRKGAALVFLIKKYGKEDIYTKIKNYPFVKARELSELINELADIPDLNDIKKFLAELLVPMKSKEEEDDKFINIRNKLMKDISLHIDSCRHNFFMRSPINEKNCFTDLYYSFRRTSNLAQLQVAFTTWRNNPNVSAVIKEHRNIFFHRSRPTIPTASEIFVSKLAKEIDVKDCRGSSLGVSWKLCN